MSYIVILHNGEVYSSARHAPIASVADQVTAEALVEKLNKWLVEIKAVMSELDLYNMDDTWMSVEEKQAVAQCICPITIGDNIRLVRSGASVNWIQVPEWALDK